MKNRKPKEDYSPSELFQNFLKNELKFSDEKVREKMAEIAKCNVHSEIYRERNRLLKSIRENMTFGQKVKILVTVGFIVTIVLFVAWVII